MRIRIDQPVFAAAPTTKTPASSAAAVGTDTGSVEFSLEKMSITLPLIDQNWPVMRATTHSEKGTDMETAEETSSKPTAIDRGRASGFASWKSRRNSGSDSFDAGFGPVASSSSAGGVATAAVRCPAPALPLSRSTAAAPSRARSGGSSFAATLLRCLRPCASDERRDSEPSGSGDESRARLRSACAAGGEGTRSAEPEHCDNPRAGGRAHDVAHANVKLLLDDAGSSWLLRSMTQRTRAARGPTPRLGPRLLTVTPSTDPPLSPTSALDRYGPVSVSATRTSAARTCPRLQLI